MDLDQFIEFLIEEGEINAEVIKKSLEVNEFPILRKILLKIEGQTTLLENVLRPKNEGEFVLAKGDLLRLCILNDKDVKQQGIKFIDDLIKKVREKFNLYSSEKKVIKNKNSNKLTSKGNETFQESEEDLSSLIKQADEFFNIGECHYELEEYEKAIENIDDAIKLNPNEDRYFILRGSSKYLSDQYEEAIKDFDEAIKLDPENEYSWDFRGRSKYFSGQKEEAIKDLDKAIKLDPENPYSWDIRGRSKYFSCQYEEAIKDLDKAIKLDPENSDPLNFRGLCNYNLDENEEAIDDFDRAIDLDPNDGSSFYYRSLAKLDSTETYKINEIIDDLNKSLSLLDDSDLKNSVLFERVLLFKKNGEYEKCLKDLSYLINQSAELKYLENRIFIYRELHKWDKAMKDILECCELDPENHHRYKAYMINGRYPNPYEVKKRKVFKYRVGYVWEIYEDRYIDPIYKSRIINLFGIDGKKDFQIALKFHSSNHQDHKLEFN